MGLGQSKDSYCNPENATDFDIAITKRYHPRYYYDDDENNRIDNIINKFKERCPEQSKISEKALVKYGGSKKPTKESVLYDGKKCVVYVGPKGGKYIRKNKKYISINI